MTHEEAIEMIKQNPLYRFEHYLIKVQDKSDITKSYDMAIEALEKQIPKKPNDYYEDSLDDECAVCGTIVFERDRYCPRCGQAIDWSEDDGR